jgi:sulfite reductase (NADPH) flavoprotein alpha-component
MIAGLWRNIHFLLAITASLFLIIAALSGAILGLEAAWDTTRPQAISLNEISLGEAKQKIEAQFEEVYEIELNSKGFLLVQGSAKNSYGSFYVDPKDGRILGKVKKPSIFFQFVRSLHRSLFLKETGRILMSFVSFLTVLLVFSGLFLMRNRMGSFLKLYTPINDPNFHRKNHIILGRWFWPLVLIVGVTGTYLGLDRLGAFTFQAGKVEKYIAGETNINLNEIPLNELEKLVYPFGNAPEEQFDLILKDRTIRFQQVDLSLIQIKLKPWSKHLQHLSYILHTGEGSLVLALLLTLTGCALIYFIFSGLKIAAKSSWALLRSTNKIQTTPLMILYGSETGNTYGFAKLLKKRLKKEGYATHLVSMNRFRIHDNTQMLIILTATYGDGEAPANASLFISQFNRQSPKNDIDYAVLGFGSRSYPKFCQYAIAVDTMLEQHPKCNSLMPLFKINKQEERSYQHWETLLLNAIQSKSPTIIRFKRNLLF